ncbi:hypothetical protein BH11BAC3_BH11BAC3_44050 [soil metagenome]
MVHGKTRTLGREWLIINLIAANRYPFQPEMFKTKFSNMIIPINEELKSICSQIIEQNLSLEEWAGIESDDMFQTNSFEGGFDATEKEFVFSYFGDKEYWFQLSLIQVTRINNGDFVNLNSMPAEH